MKQRISFPIEGMHCEGCSQTIERSLRAEEGVLTARVNFATERAMVEYDPERVPLQRIFQAVKKAGYKPKREEEEAYPRVEVAYLVTALILTPVIIYLSFFVPESSGRNYLLLALATVVQFTAGLTFYQGAYYSLKGGMANMDVLVSLGISAAYFYSVFKVLMPASLPGEELYFEASSLLICFIRFGRLLEAKARGKASQALKELFKLQADRAVLLKDGEEMEMPASEVKEGDIVLVKPGERVPVDGVIVEGSSSLDESMITGESMPVSKTVGQEVIGSTINHRGVLKVKATRVGFDTALQQIVNLVEEAQKEKAPIQRLADEISNYFVPFVVLLSLLTLGGWLCFSSQGFPYALSATISVLVIACPCALGLATPVAIVVGSGIGLKRGILIKKAPSLEAMPKLQLILFDKTGTLTKGTPEVKELKALAPWSPEDLLELASSAGSLSTHPLSTALVRRAKEKSLAVGPVSDFQEEEGKGVTCKYKGKALFMGKIEHVMNGMPVPSEVEEWKRELASQASSMTFVAYDGKMVGLVTFEDALKEGAREAVEALKRQGLRCCLVTGDNRSIAEKIAQEVSIDEVEAEVRPEEKLHIVKRYQAQGFKVAMVGDGINDAPALAQADMGIAIGAGTEVARATADIVLIKNDLMDVERSIRLGKQTLRKIKQNFFWAFVYNLAGLPVAAGILYPLWGFMMRPELAGLAMALSSLSVVLNSLLLKRYEAHL